MQLPKRSQSSILVLELESCSKEIVTISLTGFGMIVSVDSISEKIVVGGFVAGRIASKIRAVVSALSQNSTTNIMIKFSSRIDVSSSSSSISQNTLMVDGLLKLERVL